MKGNADLLLSACDSLSLGNFNKATDEFGELLESEPDNREAAAGVYISGYWNNRSDLFISPQNNQKHGALLIKEWEIFDHIAEHKNYIGLSAYKAAMQYVLNQAAAHYKAAIEKEGLQVPDRSMLVTLGQLLMKTGEFEEAAGILHYARKLSPGDARIIFLLGESLLAAGNPDLEDQGLSFYRDAFFISPQAIDLSYVSSPQISSVFTKLWDKYGSKKEDVLEWLPAWTAAVFFSAGWRKLTSDEVKYLIKEAKRLEQNLSDIKEKFLFKVKARLAFIYITLINHFTFTDPNRDLAADLEEMLRITDPELHAVLKNGSLKK